MNMMDNLPTSILLIINSYNSKIDTIGSYKVSTYYKELLEDRKNEIEYDKNDICKLYDDEIIKLLGGIGKMLEYPVLTWDTDYLGATGYIDCVKVKRLTHKVMRGVDGWNRPFITLRLHNDNNLYYRNNTYICVLFQRYADCKSSWAHSTRGGVDILGQCGHFMTNGKLTQNHVIYNIYNLLNDKGFIYIDYNNLSTIDGIRLV